MAQGIRCACRGKEEKRRSNQMNELYATRHVIRGVWDGAGSNSMCMSRPHITRDVGGRWTSVRHLDKDAKEEDNVGGQEALPVVYV